MPEIYQKSHIKFNIEIGILCRFTGLQQLILCFVDFFPVWNEIMNLCNPLASTHTKSIRAHTNLLFFINLMKTPIQSYAFCCIYTKTKK